MENVKQIMLNVDSYMTKLIEAIELIETVDFPHSEGQFSIFPFYCFCLLLTNAEHKERNAKNFAKVESGSIAKKNENIFMNFAVGLYNGSDC